MSITYRFTFIDLADPSIQVLAQSFRSSKILQPVHHAGHIHGDDTQSTKKSAEHAKKPHHQHHTPHGHHPPRRPQQLGELPPQHCRADKPWLMEIPDTFSWTEFLSLSDEEKLRNTWYKHNGPPRPLYHLALHRGTELAPLFKQFCGHRAQPLEQAAGDKS